LKTLHSPAPEPQGDLDSARIGAALRYRRKSLGLTLAEVCERAGLSAGFLSLVERGKATPSLGSLANLAVALDVSLDYFIAAPKGRRGITTAAQRQAFALGLDGVRYERLSAEFPGQTLNSVIMNVPPSFRSEVVSHEGEEILFVLEGTLEITLDGQRYVLAPGDSCHFAANVTHQWQNRGTSMARVVWVGTAPIFSRGAREPA